MIKILSVIISHSLFLVFCLEPDSDYYDKEMIDWFKKDIKSADKKWNFVFMHKPVYNLGGYRKDWGREVWSKLFEEYKVDMVFVGRSHLYERFFSVRFASGLTKHAVNYIATGGAGTELYDIQNIKVFGND